MVATLTRGLLLGLALMTVVPSTKIQRELAKAQAKYDKEDKPVGRAKQLAKLGRVEVHAAQQAVAAGHYDEALRLIEDYNEKAHQTHEALVKTGVNAAKHSNGFRQLQISLRETARDLSQMTTQIPYGQQGPFHSALKEIEALNRELIRELFPSKRGEMPPV